MDSSVFLLAIGSDHPLKDPAQEFFANAREFQSRLAVSTKVLQEMLHVYRRRNELPHFEIARELIDRHNFAIWPLEAEDVYFAQSLAERHPELAARDLCHLATCRRRAASQLKTFDRALDAAFKRDSGRLTAPGFGD